MEFQQYRKKGLVDIRPYVVGEDIKGITVSELDRQNGSPQEGDMVVRDPNNHRDQWLISAKFFENYEPINPPGMALKDTV